MEKCDLTFVDHPKYYDKALNSKATIVLINKQMECPANKFLIYTDDPFRDYNILTKKYYQFIPATKMISDNLIVGKDTVIQPGVFIANNVTIGDNCLIHSNVSIYDNVTIGDNVIIHANTVIGSDAFYFKRRENNFDKLLSCGNVIIKDNVEIGANCTIDRGVSGSTIIGEGTKMDNLIQIAHDTVIGKNCLFAAQVGIAGVVTVKDDVVLWGQVGVQKDITIGEGAIVLGKSGVAKGIEGNKVYYGNPATEAKLKMKEIAYLKRISELFNNPVD